MGVLIKPQADQIDGILRTVNIRPETAGWKYVSFAVYYLTRGQTLRGAANGRETAVVVLSGIGKAELDGQAARRMRDLPFPRYHLDNQTECEEFVGALRSFLELVPLTVDVAGLLSHWRWFGEWSLGCIGVLGDWGTGWWKRWTRCARKEQRP